jgi:aminocarboxymuconate-semialdehyde decarboxylase
MSLQTARSVDVHAHAVLPGTMGVAGKYGPEIGSDGPDRPWFRVGDYRLDGVRYEDSAFMDANLRLESMQAAGIDFQVLSPNPLSYFHHIESEQAIPYCRHHNDELAELVSQHPTRLAALASLPMQNPRAACEELRRAVGELGMLGACIGAELPLSLDSEELDDFYATLCELDVPLFIHPAPPGIDGPAGDPRLQRFDLEILLGFASQEALAIATLIYGGVMARHPALDVCLSHGGGALAVLAGRFADAARRRPWSPDYLRQDGAFEEMLSRFWVDNHVHDDAVLPLLERHVGSGHIVLGTNFSGWDQPREVDVSDPRTLQMADNARRLLRGTA